MSVCPSCNGVIGRDCWNPQECAEITAQMACDQSPPPHGPEGFLSRIAELEDALTLILPLAKGYAAAHRVGSNAEYIAKAEAAITCTKCDGRTIVTGPWGFTDCIACNPPLGTD